MIDVSDGLLKDLSRVCRSSGVSAVIEEQMIPITGEAGESRVSLGNAMLDGEDYELKPTISLMS